MSNEGGARFSLPVGEGAGAILGLAAGETAGGAFEGAYAAHTQQAVVVAYHLFRHGRVDRARLAGELAELDGDDQDPTVLRAPSPELRQWLDSLAGDETLYASETSLDPAVRAVPLGVWYRRRAGDLVEAVLETSRVTHLDGPSAVVATAVAGAVAGSCFAQNGRDLLMAVAEIADLAVKEIESDDLRYAYVDRLDSVSAAFRRATSLVGSSSEEIVGGFGDDPTGRAAAALTLAAPATARPEALIENAAEIGGSALAAITGAVLGARLGARKWPWAFPNDTWFVAIGERLVEGRSDLVDLPVPYAVEQRVTYAADYQRL